MGGGGWTLTHRENVGAGAHVLPAESGQQLTVVFCGTLEICWFVSLKIIDDSANDMAAINISHLNKVINGLEE